MAVKVLNQIFYVEIDRVPVCLKSGWCEREAAHDGPCVRPAPQSGGVPNHETNENVKGERA